MTPPAPPAPPAPLPTLLSHALSAYVEEFARAAADARIQPEPSLPVWANVLQHVDRDDGTKQLDLRKRACVTQRSLRPALNKLTERGLLTVEDKIVRLTAAGRRAVDDARPLFDDVERRWQERLGKTRVRSLRTSLEAVVAQVPIELPHHPCRYGPVDPRITGGNGAEWRPRARAEGSVVAGELPLSALLSQALAAFAIDYEQRNGALSSCANVLRLVPEDGIPVADLPPEAATLLGPLHWHHFVEIDDDQRVRLIELGRYVRDRHESTMAKVEQSWRDTYGDANVDRLRAALEPVVARLDCDGYPHLISLDGLWPD